MNFAAPVATPSDPGGLHLEALHDVAYQHGVPECLVEAPPRDSFPLDTAPRVLSDDELDLLEGLAGSLPAFLEPSTA